MSASQTPRARRCGARCANSSAMAAYRRCPMPKKRNRLRLVSSDDPAGVFDGAQAAPAAPAFQGQPTFARIPHDRARRLYHLRGGAVWVLLIELDRLILEGRGRNPVKLTSQCLKAMG